MNYFDIFKNTESAIKNKQNDSSTSKLRRFKFFITLVLKLNKKINEDETKYGTFYSNSKAETIVHNSDINNMLESIQNTIVRKHKSIWQKPRVGRLDQL